MKKHQNRWLDRRIGAPGPFLTLCLTEAEFEAAVKHCKLPATPQWVTNGKAATLHSFTGGPKGMVCIVCLGDVARHNAIEIAGLLIHEAVHVWQHWCDDVGETHPGAEQEAYGVQAVAQELMAEYARRIWAR
jgi:hypothetical protein